jgi:hypothetical protein
MPGRHGLRPLKAWRYVGVFGAELMVCVAAVRIGPARQSFWAVWDGRRGRLHERTALGAAGVRLSPGQVHIAAAGVGIERWRWSAGVGRASDGRALAWNLVDGINDPPEHSERTVWIDGEPRELPPARFAPHLSGVDELAFTPEATRERHENRLLVRSRYRQPFGTFAGRVGGAELAEGYGVMEDHDVWW